MFSARLIRTHNAQNNTEDSHSALDPACENWAWQSE